MARPQRKHPVVPFDAPCLDEPYTPRERSVIHADLAECCRLYLSPDDQAWFAEHFPLGPRRMKQLELAL